MANISKMTKKSSGFSYGAKPLEKHVPKTIGSVIDPFVSFEEFSSLEGTDYGTEITIMEIVIKSPCGFIKKRISVMSKNQAFFLVEEDIGGTESIKRIGAHEVHRYIKWIQTLNERMKEFGTMDVPKPIVEAPVSFWR